MDDVRVAISKRLRDKVWRGLTFTLGFLVLLLAFWNAINNHLVIELALFEFIIAVFSFYIFFKVKQWPTIGWLHYLYTFLLIVLVSYAIWIRPLENALIVWALCLPIIFYLALGQKMGLLFSTFALAVLLILLTFKLEAAGMVDQIPVRLNLAFSFICIAGIADVYERNRVRIETELVNLALTDALTGVRNRLAFKQDFAHHYARQQAFGLLMLDIDHFKKVNDTHGHDVGDEILLQLTQRIEGLSARHRLYRHGGEEFCILVEGNRNHVVDFAHFIRSEIEKWPFRVSEKEISITISIGVAAINERSENSSEVVSEMEMVKLADQRLYEAKRAGRNRVIFSPTSDDFILNK